MPGRYASQTTVSSEQSKFDVERVLARYGADQFGYTTEPGRAMIAFRLRGRIIRLVVPLPDRNDKVFTTYVRGGYDYERVENEAQRLWEQACRQRWRALHLVVKAKLEAAELGITTIEDEWLAHTVLPDGTTFGEWAQPQLTKAIQGSTMPPLLGGGR